MKEEFFEDYRKRGDAFAILKGAIMAIVENPDTFEKEHVLAFLKKALKTAIEIREIK